LPELQVSDDIRYQLPNFESIAPCDVLYLGEVPESKPNSEPTLIQLEPPSEPEVEEIKKKENPVPSVSTKTVTEPAKLSTPVVGPTVFLKVSPPRINPPTVSTQSEGRSEEILMPPVNNSNLVEKKTSPQIDAEKKIQDSRPKIPLRTGWGSLMDDIKNRSKALRPATERKVEEQNITANPTLQDILKEKMKNIHDSQNGLKSPQTEKDTDSGDESWDEEN